MRIPCAPILSASLAACLTGPFLSAEPAPGRTVHHVAVDAEREGREAVIAKAANLVPSAAQMAHHRLEFTSFMHFGINTFTGNEWGSGTENPAVFNPGESIDTDQWCRAVADAGVKLVLFTVKHHDGFCLWQTRYNSKFSVECIPWRGGKGDIVRDLAESCRKSGLKFGIYLSPADLYQMESPQGYYGNDSKARMSVIPTDPASFSTDPSRSRTPKSGSPVFQYEVDDYNRYFMNQLYELLTEYGPVQEVWLDGAQPKQKGTQKYDKEKWFDMIHKMLPDCVIFGGPDVRWCGNEAGRTRDVEWSVLPVENLAASWLDRTQEDVASIDSLMRGSYDVYGVNHKSNFLYYLISEVDVSIRAGWFWRNDHEQSVRTPDDVFDMYERAVGGNNVFLLNVPVNNKGLFSPRDLATLAETGRRIRSTYGDSSLNQGVTSDATQLLDGKPDTFWSPSGEKGEVAVRLPEARTFNRVVVQEAIGQVGQRVASHAVDAWVAGAWKEIATGKTIGYKKILRFPPVTTNAIRFRVLESRMAPAISELSIFNYTPPAPALAISRIPDGKVRIAPSQAPGTQGERLLDPQFSIHYTTDGSAPTASSPEYNAPFELPDGGKVQAVAVSRKQSGNVTEAWLGMVKKEWKVVHVDSEHDSNYGAAKAIDDDPSTFWHTDWSKSPGHPHELVVDLGRPVDAAGFTYLPRQDKPMPDGMIENGTIAFSRDGVKWSAPQDFTFGNLLNDPSRRIFQFKAKFNQARYFKIVSKTGAAGKPYAGAAEIDVLTMAR